MSSANDPAFPVVKTNWPNASRHDTYSIGGLTKREYFAAMAMQGFVANKARPTNFLPEDDATYCVAIADALLSELERTNNDD